MQSKSWKIHVFRSARHVEISQDARNLLPVSSADPRWIVTFIEPPQPIVPEAADHNRKVGRNPKGVNASGAQIADRFRSRIICVNCSNRYRLSRGPGEASGWYCTENTGLSLSAIPQLEPSNSETWVSTAF